MSASQVARMAARRALEYGGDIFHQRRRDLVVVVGRARAPPGHPIVEFWKSGRSAHGGVPLCLQRDEGRKIVRIVGEGEPPERTEVKSGKNHEAGREIIVRPGVIPPLRHATDVEEYFV